MGKTFALPGLRQQHRINIRKEMLYQILVAYVRSSTGNSGEDCVPKMVALRNRNGEVIVRGI